LDLGHEIGRIVGAISQFSILGERRAQPCWVGLSPVDELTDEFSLHEAMVPEVSSP
jgi:hypothetical protein